MDYGILTLLPPIIALVIAIVFKKVALGLLLGVFSSFLILTGGNPLTAVTSTIDTMISVLADGGNTKLLLFTSLMGAIVLLSKKSGGVEGFVDYLTVKTKMIKNRRAAMLFAFILGVILFINGSLSIIFIGMLALPIFDSMRIPREKLGYILDSTAAPVGALLPLNAWGAYIMGLIAAQISAGYIDGEPLTLLVESLPLQFYSICALAVLVIVMIVLNKDIGPMKKAEERVATTGALVNESEEAYAEKEELSGSANGDKWNMLIPLIVLIVSAFVSLFITGKGNMMKGSGSTSVLYAVLVTLIVMYFLYTGRKCMTGKEFGKYLIDGISSMLPIVFLLWISMAIGTAISELGTGTYLASLVAGVLSGAVAPMVIFLLGAVIAFCTGTSFGTFSIMFPIAIPIAVAVGANIPLMIGAIISGGLFGDHCSPLSDTTILSSMASGTSLLAHTRTQIPYAVISAVIAAVLFVVFGFVL